MRVAINASHTPAPTSIAAVASFRTWRSSQFRVARGQTLTTIIGGERGIRTLGTSLTHTRFPIVLLRPLGHLSIIQTKLISAF